MDYGQEGISGKASHDHDPGGRHGHLPVVHFRKIFPGALGCHGGLPPAVDRTPDVSGRSGQKISPPGTGAGGKEGLAAQLHQRRVSGGALCPLV